MFSRNQVKSNTTQIRAKKLRNKLRLRSLRAGELQGAMSLLSMTVKVHQTESDEISEMVDSMASPPVINVDTLEAIEEEDLELHGDSNIARIEGGYWVGNTWFENPSVTTENSQHSEVHPAILSRNHCDYSMTLSEAKDSKSDSDDRKPAALTTEQLMAEAMINTPDNHEEEPEERVPMPIEGVGTKRSSREWNRFTVNEYENNWKRMKFTEVFYRKKLAIAQRAQKLAMEGYIVTAKLRKLRLSEQLEQEQRLLLKAIFLKTKEFLQDTDRTVLDEFDTNKLLAEVKNETTTRGFFVPTNVVEGEWIKFPDSSIYSRFKAEYDRRWNQTNGKGCCKYYNWKVDNFAHFMQDVRKWLIPLTYLEENDITEPFPWNFFKSN